jgi:capsular polysaccharide biosynthesis protein
VRSISPLVRRDWRRAQRDDLGLPEVLNVLWGWRHLIAVLVLVLGVVGIAVGLLREPVYTAEAEVSLQPQSEVPDEDLIPFVEEVKGAVITDEFLREVREEAGWSAGPEAFGERLDVGTFVARDGAPGMRVRFSGDEAQSAARAANAYANLFVERVERLNDQRLAGGALAADARVVREASPPESLPGPGPLLYAAVAVAAGVLLGGGLALLLEGRAHSWRDARDAELTLRAPVLGVIPEYPLEQTSEERA